MFGINKIAKLVWEPCQRRTDDQKPECMPPAQQKTWIQRQKISLTHIHSHNFIDFDSFDQPLQRAATGDRLGNLYLDGMISTEMPLVMYDVSIQDNILNPLPSESQNFQFLSLSQQEKTKTTKV